MGQVCAFQLLRGEIHAQFLYFSWRFFPKRQYFFRSLNQIFRPCLGEVLLLLREPGQPKHLGVSGGVLQGVGPGYHGL